MHRDKRLGGKEKVVLERITDRLYSDVKRLYVSAFPRCERPPFRLLKSRAKKGLGDFWVATEGETLIGFAYVIPYLDTAYLYYFAVSEGLRGMGYGCGILTELKNIYADKRFYLAREMLDKGADNYGQRVKRRAFYLKNGFADLPIKIKEASVTFDVMGIGGIIKREEYDAMMTAYCGRLIRRFIDMRLIDGDAASESAVKERK